MTDIIINSLPTLALISVLTSLTTEAIKKLCDKADVNYISNIIAVVVAFVLSIAIAVVYPIVYQGAELNAQLICTGISTGFISAIIAMCGYDKVVSAIKQLKE